MAQRLRNATCAPVALMNLVRVGRVEHAIEADIFMHMPVPHQRPAPEQIDAGLLGGNFVQQRRQHFAWPAPLGPKVHEDGLMGLENFAFEVRLVDFNGRLHVLFPFFIVTIIVTQLHKK